MLGAAVPVPALPERQDFSAETDRVRLSKVALKAYKRLVEHWGLTGQQAAALLDVSTSTWERLKQEGKDKTLSQDQLESWGWRIAFFIGGVLGLVGMWLRRSLVEPELFHRLVQRVAEEHDQDLNMAARIMDQALAFLGTSATHQGRPLAPSDIVDPGWHEFILHTVDYARFCEQIAGRFLHHVPTDPDDPNATGEAAHDTLTRTVDAIAAAGFYVDGDLWPTAHHVECSQCHQGCTSSPA
jgi:hypothetical protein